MIGEFIYMLPSDMNLRIGNIRNYNNKILISSPSFKIGTNAKINIDGEQAKLKPGFHTVFVGLCGSLRVAQFWERP